MKIIFFEIDAINIKRYYLDVLPDLIGNSDASVIIESEAQKSILKKLNINLPVVVLETETAASIQTLIQEADFLLINGQRIPDIYLTLVAKKVQTKVIYLQHGMYIPHMKRGLKFFMKSLLKSYRYFKYGMLSARVDKNPKLLISLLRTHLVDGNREYDFNRESGLPDMSFVFSQYWVEWHKEHYFRGNYNKFVIVGNPDPIRFKNVHYENGEITYCYQTLIEDGRINKDYMLGVFDRIIDWVESSGKQLIVKGHPRMSSEIVEFFKSRGAILVKDNLPITETVIGHYSSLMPMWTYYGVKVFSLELEGHEVAPSIKETSVPVKTLQEVNKKEVSPKFLKEKVKYYFNYNSKYSPEVWNWLSLNVEK